MPRIIDNPTTNRRWAKSVTQRSNQAEHAIDQRDLEEEQGANQPVGGEIEEKRYSIFRITKDDRSSFLRAGSKGNDDCRFARGFGKEERTYQELDEMVSSLNEDVESLATTAAAQSEKLNSSR